MKSMNLIIEEMQAFTLVGLGRDFRKDACYKEIPEFWNEHAAGDCKGIDGMFGICIDREDSVHYLIADLYRPWISVLRGWEAVTFETGKWAIFSANGPLPKSLQTVNTYVWNEWVPKNGKYAMRANYNLEFYPHEIQDSQYNHSEIWLPVREI